MEDAAGTGVSEPAHSATRSGRRRDWRRVTSTVLLSIGGVLTVLCALLVAGCWADDLAIERPEPGRATAEVVSVSFSRTIVRYNTPEGAVHIPNEGVLYPEGLQEGQLVRVEYDTAQPDKKVRVEGRDFRLALLPVGTTVAGLWAVLVPAVWWLRRKPVAARQS
ncbi:hypothetical protein GCM10012275_63130 [Longimycelium tulufanense]|uniref:DUF3592 domain-containing protein n=1 Tax=Longimycelium tulufanense TaxID=907463 RepID=A0A8J3FZU2_9PSEU|nr:DUF3592 domain-containing protein [Longimycelium tulufanense]GGM83884.1 hypothetical protein GCM10012275_63130 [Longimycelium tulufanense]